MYTDIPKHYIDVLNHWQRRHRGGEKVVARMYTVSPKDEEIFYLRLLLLDVPGPTSSKSLHTFNGVTNASFKLAAAARGRLESDDEWDNCLEDAAIYQMPKQMRDTFAYMGCESNEIAINKGLHEIEKVLKQHSLSCE